MSQTFCVSPTLAKIHIKQATIHQEHDFRTPGTLFHESGWAAPLPLRWYYSTAYRCTSHMNNLWQEGIGNSEAHQGDSEATVRRGKVEATARQNQGKSESRGNDEAKSNKGEAKVRQRRGKNQGKS